MTALRLLVLLAIAMLVGCASVATEARPDVYVMRHLQKADGPDPALSAEGQRNAQRLARWFRRDPPAAIYVSTTRRARETAAPLAAGLGLTMRDYDPSDTPALIAAVTREPGTVLIVGHSNTVPEIVERLGGTRPPGLTDDQYGDIWHVSGPRRAVERLQLPPED